MLVIRAGITVRGGHLATSYYTNGIKLNCEIADGDEKQTRILNSQPLFH